jgi:tetratricopeptide (TPR) repeat protein
VTTADDAVPPWARHHIPKFAAILRSLERVPGFILQPLEVPSRDVAQVLAAWLTAHGRPTRIITPTDDSSWAALAAALTEPPDDTRVIVMSGPDAEEPAMRRSLAMVNLHRDGIARALACPLLWCGPPEFLRATWEQAPDFWSIAAIPKQLPPSDDRAWIPLLDVDSTVIREANIESLKNLYGAARDQGDIENQIRLGMRLIPALQRSHDSYLPQIIAELGHHPWGPGLSVISMAMALRTREPLAALLAHASTQYTPRFKAQILLGIGVIDRRNARPEDAHRELSEAVKLFEEIGDINSEILARIKLAEMQVKIGHLQDVESHVWRILHLLQSTVQDVDTLDHAGLIICLFDAAKERITTALNVTAALRATNAGVHPSLSAAVEHVEGCLRAQVGDFVRARDHLSRALTRYEALDSNDGAAQVRRALAALPAVTGEA